MTNQSKWHFFAGWGRRQQHRQHPPTLRAFALGLVALYLVAVGMGQVRAGVWLDAVILVGGGLLLWLWHFGRWEATATPLIGSVSLRVSHWWLGVFLALGAGGLAVWNWRNLSVAAPTDGDWLWYLASIALVIVAALVVEARPRPTARTNHVVGVGWIVLGVVAIGAAVRLIFLSTLPFGTWYDEAANGLEALRIVREPMYRPIYTDGVNSTGHYLWLIVFAFRLFGENTFAVRSISALMGIATIAAAYAAGRELHSMTLGLVWAILVAVARWSITFSRIGMYNSATPLFELLALFWLLRGLRRGSVLDFTLAGVAIGFGLCFYPAFQLYLAVLGVLVAVVTWRERTRWRTMVLGLGVCALATLLVIAPVVKYALARPESYFARVQTTSLFAGKAPDERLPALWENTRKHLLMFNIHGDPNGRHNLPGAPMLDWLSGGMLVVGLAMCLRRVLSPRFLIVPVWIVVGLLGGILSLDFEAPQSLRAIGALPAVLLCAALPPVALIDTWRNGAGRDLPQAGFWIVVSALLLPAGWSNLNTYFVRQARDFAAWNAYSTPETIAAQLLRDADPAMDKYVISLFDGHPTVRFLAQGVNYRRVETNTTLPILRDMPNGMLLILDTERNELYDEARRLYPNAAFEEIRPPYGGPVVVYVNRLTAQDLQSIEGLMGVYTPQSGAGMPIQRKDMQLDFEWPAAAPVSLPFSAEWSGVLATNTYGPYQFFLQAPGQATLWIGETKVIEGNGSNVEGLGGGIMLARGHHTIRLRVEGGEGRVRLAWQPPDGPPETVPPWALYVAPVQSKGLLGNYYANGNWEGEPAFAQIDPRLSMYFHVPTLPRPYTVEWQGKLAIPQAGHYDFALQSIDESRLMIDGNDVVATVTRNGMATAGVELEAGLHDIVVRYADRTDHTFINLTWRTPGGDGAYRTIPSELLFPPQENYDQVDVGDLTRFVQSEAQLPTEVVRDQVDPASVDIVVTGLAQPRGVAVANGIVYVTEAGNHRVLALDASTGAEVPGPFDGVTLSEPFDLAAQADGSLALIDATSGQLLRYDAGAGVIDTIAVPRELVERSRGIGAWGDNELWVANTAGQKVVAVDNQGAPVQEIILPAVSGDDAEMQPVDVAVMPDNTLYVTDVAGNVLYRFSRAGYLIASQPIPVANSLDSAHLAVDSAGNLYMTEPEGGRVVRLSAEGIIERVWNVRTPEAPDAKPVGIAVDPDGSIWVADSQGGRVLHVTPEDGE